MTQMKDELKNLIDELPDELIEDLRPLLLRMSEWEATNDIVRDADMIAQIQESEADWAEEETVNWRDVTRQDL
jgi:hypothetical protein